MWRKKMSKKKYDLGHNITSNGNNEIDVKEKPITEKKKEKDDPLDAQFTDPPPVDDTAPPVSFFKLYTYATIYDKLMIFVGCICAVGTGLVAPANTLLIGDLTEAMVRKGMVQINGSAEAIEAAGSAFIDAINYFAIANTILGVAMLILSYLSIMLFNTAAINQIYRIRGKFLRSALNQDIAWYDLNKSGDFASRMTEDIAKLEDGIGEKVVMVVHFVVSFLGSLILAFIKGWELALICLISLPVMFISIGFVSRVTSKLAKKEMNAYGKAGSIAEEVLGSMRTVVAFGGQKKESERFQENLVDAKDINIKRGMFGGITFGIIWFVIYASYALAFWYGIGLVLRERELPPNEITYTAGVMVTVFFSIMMGSMNLGMASPYFEAFGIACGAGAKVFSVIESIPKINPLAAIGIRPDSVQGNVSFKNVHFEYPSRSDVPVLKGLTLDIKRGETIALVGNSGCGKSTCIQLIQRFYDPVDGQITLDGNDIRELDVNWLREKIGVVGQEPVLFGTTIYDNISYGRENVTKDEIERSAKVANAHEFIKKLPQGYNTLVGERGAQLSGGQKQRIAIARALVRSPEILLLDEATSALDTASEAQVQAALDKASQGRTTIIVAHRLSTIRNADQIYVLSDGAIVEQGNHDTLMALEGHYYALVTTQLGTQQDPDLANSNDQLQRVLSVTSKTSIERKDSVVPDYNMEDEEDTVIASDVKLIQIIKLNEEEWPYILVGAICSIILGCAMPLFAVVFGNIIGVLSDPDPDVVRSESNMYCLYFVLMGIVSGLSMFMQIYMFSIAGEKLTLRLRGMAFAAMLRQEMAWFDDKANGTGTLCARLSGDAAAVQGATGQRVGTVLQSLATLLLGVGLAMFYEWKLGLLTFAFTPLILLFIFMQGRIVMHENAGQAEDLQKSTKLSVEVVSNIRTVVSLGRERMFHEQYLMLLLPSIKTSKRNTHYRGAVYGFARSVMFFAYAASMYYGGYLVENDNLHYEVVFKVSQALIMGTVSIANALAFAPNFQKGYTAAQKIMHLLRRQPRVIEPQQSSIQNWVADGNVSYHNVGFFYPTRQNQQVLKGLDLNILKGQTVALVGPSGCGKSTCVQLLERFYDPTEGNLFLDEHDISSVTLAQLRAQLGIVSQEPTLFDRTIAQNIAYGDNSREVPIAEVIEVANQANIHNFIVSLPLGYETRMGERGTQLSGGQKQRVAIARALVRNPRVLLLDEATSALDMESEKIVQEALDKAKEGRTCITIAHRLTTIQDADVICVVDNGKIAEMGKHNELLAKKGMYYKLYTLQNRKR